MIGQVLGAFGLRGEAKVLPFTDVEDRFDRLETVFVGRGHAEYRVESSRRHKGLELLKLEGVDSVDDARSLQGSELSIPRASVDPLPAGHYYLEDLVGVTVSTSAGTPVGTITEVLQTGSNDVFVVGSGRDAVLVPGTHEAVAKLDLHRRHMVIEPWVLTPDEG